MTGEVTEINSANKEVNNPILEKYSGLGFLANNPDVERFTAEEKDGKLTIGLSCREGFRLTYVLQIEGNERTRLQELYYNRGEKDQRFRMMEALSLVIEKDGKRVDLVEQMVARGVTPLVFVKAPNLTYLPDSVRDDYWMRNMYTLFSSRSDPAKMDISLPVLTSYAGLASFAHEFGHFIDILDSTEEEREFSSERYELSKKCFGGYLEPQEGINEWSKKIDRISNKIKRRGERAADYYGLKWFRKIAEHLRLGREALQIARRTVDFTLLTYELSRPKEYSLQEERAVSNPDRLMDEFTRIMIPVAEELERLYTYKTDDNGKNHETVEK